MQLPASIIRVACDASRTDSFVNEIGKRTPVIPKAGTVQIPCAVFAGDSNVAANLVTDLGNLVTANLVVRAGGTATGPLLIEKVIAAADFNAGLTYSAWTAGTAAHFTFALSDTDTNQTITGDTLWIAIGVTTTGSGDIPLVFCSNAKLKDYGIFDPGAPTAPDYTSWSKEEADARYPLKTGVSFFDGTITSVGDGGAHSLEMLDTTAMATPALRELYLSAATGDEPQSWYLLPGTDTNDATHQRPHDYNASTNAKVWVRRR